MIAFGVSDGHWSWERFSFQLYRSWTTDSMMNLHGSIKMLTVGKATRDPSAPQTLLYPLYLVGWSLDPDWHFGSEPIWVSLKPSITIPKDQHLCHLLVRVWKHMVQFRAPTFQAASEFLHFITSIKACLKKNKTVLMGDNLEFIFIPRCYDCRTWIKPNQWTFPFLECMSSCSWNYIHWFHFIIIQEKQEFMERSQWCCLADTTRLERGPCRSLEC